MKPDKDREFEQNISQLVHLLKKIMKHVPQNGQGQAGMPGKQINFKEQGLNMNICFFSFLPFSPEDLDEWEDLYDQYLGRESADGLSEELTMDLSPSDIDFLKDHGIRF